LDSNGSAIFETNTGSDQPVGAPVVYDWYGNGQKVVLLAAGNKLYGWDENGQSLPRFPFKLQEQIAAPLLVSDINSDGQPEAFVATTSRELHALNRRGEDLEGWPVSTNSIITSPLSIGKYKNEKIIFAFAGNTAHGWRTDGSTPAPFPAFIDAPFTGSPIIFKDYILGNAANGKVYSMGNDPLFETSSGTDSGGKALNVSGSSLSGSPQVQTMSIHSNGETYHGPALVTTDSNGALFYFTSSGKLLFNTNIGQPAKSGFSPIIADIDGDGIHDILTLGRYGSLHAWTSLNGTKLDILPSASMEYPIIADIDEDGFVELIAQTNDGLRCWTIYGK